MYNISNAYLQITDVCNLNCKYCYVGKNNNNYLDISLFKNIIKFLIKNNCNQIFLTGGECSIHPNFYDMLEYLERERLSTIILTNGISLDFDLLLNYRSIINKIIISLDGFKEGNDINRGKGTYEKIINSISRLISENFIIELAVTVNKLNYYNCFELIELCNTYGITEISFNISVLQGLEKKENILNEDEISEVLAKINYYRWRNEMKIKTNILLKENLELYKYMYPKFLVSMLWIDFNGNISIFPISEKNKFNIYYKNYFDIANRWEQDFNGIISKIIDDKQDKYIDLYTTILEEATTYEGSYKFR